MSPKLSKKEDLLIDRNCVMLDGSCKCVKPFEECKYLKREENKKQV